MKMGVRINELVPSKEIDFRDLSGKKVAVDSSLFLYQFLTTIRQPDGTPLMDSKGGVTSHLVGLFSRTTRLMQYGIKLVYVFDGEPPGLKSREQQRRRELKREASQKYRMAVEREDVEEMSKYAKRSSSLNAEMIEEAEKLVLALGLPVVHAPSEAEAQAAHMVINGDCFALATQDADALMFGAPKIVRNLSFVGKRRLANKLSYHTVKPELIDLSETLNLLGIDQEQLIVMCMLVGTDYNTGGVKGIGPKNALKLVQQHGKNFDKVFAEVEWSKNFAEPWREIFQLIKEIPTTDKYALEWRAVDEESVKRLLVDNHDFSSDRISSTMRKLATEKVVKQQKGLGDFF
jgi:flap endonuclease-1